jgi:uncharacterized protein (TIGR00369 family)
MFGEEPQFETTWHSEDLARVRDELASVPLHQFYGVEILALSPGHGRARLTVSDNTANVHGWLHGGVYYAVLDIVAYLGVVPLLEVGENAVTHDIHVSVLRPAERGQTLELVGVVRKRGRTLVFCESEAWIDGKLAASARVTKSFVRDDSFAWRSET